ncbi:MAG: SH3 domain-containing protein [Hyphomicrobiaceae bacterium]
MQPFGPVLALSVVVAMACATLLGHGPVQAQQQAIAAGPRPPPSVLSGLPVPRFVSLKSSRVHARQGPGMDHKVLWVYRRAGLPLEVIREYEGWRQVRDSDGAESWIVHSLVSGRRTALVMPWETKQKGSKPKLSLLASANASARPVAIIEAGVLANVKSCDTRWCLVSVGSFRGFIPQKSLWGVYPGEVIE